MAFLLLLVMLTACHAAPVDMSEKTIIFPQETNTAHAKLLTSTQSLKEVTVCLRTFSDLARSYASFSLATPTHQNGFLIFRDANENVFKMFVMEKSATFSGLGFLPNVWHSLCATWDSVSGLGQLWLDGKPSSRKYIISGSSITKPFSIILGQEQDSHGGGFHAKQSFVGMMSDVHMWNYTISPCEIRRFTDELAFTPGNVLNWEALHFQTSGRVVIENKQRGCL